MPGLSTLPPCTNGVSDSQEGGKCIAKHPVGPVTALERSWQRLWEEEGGDGNVAPSHAIVISVRRI